MIIDIDKFQNKLIFKDYSNSLVYKIRNKQDLIDYLIGSNILNKFGIRTNPIQIIQIGQHNVLTIEPLLFTVTWQNIKNYIKNYLAIFQWYNIGDICENNWGKDNNDNFILFDFALNKTNVTQEFQQLNGDQK